MITRFYNEFGLLKYSIRLLHTKYALCTNDYMLNPNYYTQHKTRGFNSIADAAVKLEKKIGDYTYEFNDQGVQTYCKNNKSGAWFKKTYDNFGNWVSFERSDGRYWKITYTNGILSSYVDSDSNWWDITKLSTALPPYEPLKIGNGQQLFYPDQPDEGYQLSFDLDFT